MEIGHTTMNPPAEVREFIKFIKDLDEEQQAGLCLTLEGLRIFSDKF